MWEICAAGFQTNKQRFGSRNFGIHSLSLLKSAGGVKLGTGTAWSVTKREIFVLLTPCRASRECGIIFARLFGSSSLEQMVFFSAGLRYIYFVVV